MAHLYHHLKSEDTCEDVIHVLQSLEPNGGLLSTAGPEAEPEPFWGSRFPLDLCTDDHQLSEGMLTQVSLGDQAPPVATLTLTHTPGGRTQIGKWGFR